MYEPIRGELFHLSIGYLLTSIYYIAIRIWYTIINMQANVHGVGTLMIWWCLTDNNQAAWQQRKLNSKDEGGRLNLK